LQARRGGAVMPQRGSDRPLTWPSRHRIAPFRAVCHSRVCERDGGMPRQPASMFTQATESSETGGFCTRRVVQRCATLFAVCSTHATLCARWCCKPRCWLLVCECHRVGVFVCLLALPAGCNYRLLQGSCRLSFRARGWGQSCGYCRSGRVAASEAVITAKMSMLCKRYVLGAAHVLTASPTTSRCFIVAALRKSRALTGSCRCFARALNGGVV
jgi:hypothetical protein